ncbi:MAG: LysM peptidoglycan-binding domain-containing protein [Chloroflexi bacterium]|nr:LysM peptidoglycan-binding domain-containing protein [Chloroflexota bacterium]
MSISITKRILNLIILLIAVIASSACTTHSAPDETPNRLANPTNVQEAPTPAIVGTPLPTRPVYDPGELVEYIVQNGDTLPALAAHFNTSIDEILETNPIIPRDVTTLPSGLPLQIPIYYRPFWGSPYQIIPDSQFVNGPGAINFDTQEFVDQYDGWLRDYVAYAAGANRTGAGVIDYVAGNFSISPRVLLAILEYQTGALSDPELPSDINTYPLGYRNYTNRGLYLQLVWAANVLNNSYYGWRTGSLTSFDHPDGRMEQPDPWQNAATVALQIYFNHALEASLYPRAIGYDGFAQLFASLYGNPWTGDIAHIPGSLIQPEMQLPFEPNIFWAFTGGPHTGWGSGEPLAALDFAPPAMLGGCQQTELWATAIADGLVVRSERGIVVLDLDADGDERTGWVIFYLHLETRDRAQVGAYLGKGEHIGHPSCEGGITTGTHVHLGRKYNGEWIPAAGALPFVLEGWVTQGGEDPYEGSLTRFGRTVHACECSLQENQLASTANSVDVEEDIGTIETETP